MDDVKSFPYCETELAYLLIYDKKLSSALDRLTHSERFVDD
jgi:hypothetical protein